MVPDGFGHFPEYREVTGTPRGVNGPYCVLEHLQPLAPPGRIKIAPWGRAGDTLGAGAVLRPVVAPSSPPGAEIGPLCSPISANKGPIWARIGPYSAWFRRVSAFNYQHNYFLSHISSQKNQILQQNSTTTNSSIQII